MNFQHYNQGLNQQYAPQSTSHFDDLQKQLNLLNQQKIQHQQTMNRFNLPPPQQQSENIFQNQSNFGDVRGQIFQQNNLTDKSQLQNDMVHQNHQYLAQSMPLHPQDYQMQVQPNQIMAPQQQMNIIHQQVPLQKQMDYSMDQHQRYPAQNQIGQTLRAQPPIAQHQSFRSQNIGMYDQGPPHQQIPQHMQHPQMNQPPPHQNNRVENRPNLNHYQQSQGHQGSERNDHYSQQMLHSKQLPQKQHLPPPQQAIQGSHKQKPMPQNQFSSISSLSTSVTINNRGAKQQSPSHPSQPVNMAIPQEVQNPIMPETNNTQEADYVDPDSVGQNNQMVQNIHQDEQSFNQNNNYQSQSKQNNTQTQSLSQNSHHSSQNQIKQQQHNMNDDELDNTYPLYDDQNNQQQDHQDILIEENSLGGHGENEIDLNQHEEGENEYTQFQSQYYNDRNDLTNDHSQMVYDQMSDECSQESHTQEIPMDLSYDPNAQDGYDGDQYEGESLEDQDGFNNQPSDYIDDGELNQNDQESQYRSKHSYENYRGGKNRKQALSQNSFDQHEDDALDQNQEKNHDDQYLTVDDGNVSASHVSHFQESFGRAPQNSNDLNNISTVSMGNGSGTFFQNKEGPHKSSAPENSASFGDFDNQENGEEDASRSKLQLTDEDQTIDPTLDDQEQEYQEENDQIVAQQLPEGLTDFTIQQIISHNEHIDEEGKFVGYFFLCQIEYVETNEKGDKIQIDQAYWVPSSAILETNDFMDDQSQVSQGQNINQVHLKFYCSSQNITLDGLEKVQDLLDHSQNQSSGVKSQDPIFQEEDSPKVSEQITQEIWSAQKQKKIKSDEKPKSLEDSEEDVSPKKVSRRKRLSKKVEESSPEKNESSKHQQDDDEDEEEDQPRIKTRSGRISKRPLQENGYISDISTLKKAKKQVPRNKSSQKKPRGRSRTFYEEQKQESSQQLSDDIEDNLSENFDEMEMHKKDDEFNASEASQDNNSDSSGEYLTNTRNQGNALGLGNFASSSQSNAHSQIKNQDYSKECDDEDQIAVPQRKSSTRKYSLRNRDEEPLNKREEKQKRKSNKFTSGYKTQPYEPNDQFNENYDSDEDQQSQEQSEEQEEERPKKKVAAWQIAHKNEFERNHNNRNRRRQIYDADEAKLMKRNNKNAKDLIKLGNQINGCFNLGHEPLKVIKFYVEKGKKNNNNGDMGAWNEFEDAEEKEQINPNNYPYHKVTCKVQWAPIKGTNENISILDSKVSYEELREKAPHLLCEFFERHMELS